VASSWIFFFSAIRAFPSFCGDSFLLSQPFYTGIFIYLLRHYSPSQTLPIPLWSTPPFCPSGHFYQVLRFRTPSFLVTATTFSRRVFLSSLPRESCDLFAVTDFHSGTLLFLYSLRIHPFFFGRDLFSLVHCLLLSREHSFWSYPSRSSHPFGFRRGDLAFLGKSS